VRSDSSGEDSVDASGEVSSDEAEELEYVFFGADGGIVRRETIIPRGLFGR
jgi:hypothetical protein